MTPRRWKILITLALLLMGLSVVEWWQNVPKPRHRMPEWTPAEKHTLKKVMRERGPNYTIQRIPGMIFYRNDKGKECRVKI